MNQRGILDGVNVLELASVLAGPSVGMFLAELGASVTKIENPRTGGDVTRSWKLPSESKEKPTSSYYNAVNWGKSIDMVDLKSVEGLKTVSSLIQKSDIILVSFKPGDAEKLGLEYEAVTKIRPDIIYASITGYGDDDPRTAYDALLQAESGFMHLNRKPGASPLKMPVALIDILAAHQLKQLVLVAWIQKLKTGEGSHVEVSLFESAVSSLANQAGAWLYANTEPEPMGSEHPHIYPYGSAFKTGDGRSIVLAVGNDRQFQALCEILNINNISEQDDFSTNPARSANRNALREVLESAFMNIEDSESLLGDLHAKMVPAAIIRKVGEAVELYCGSFHTHKDGNLKGIPTITGRINGKPAAASLSFEPQ